MLYIIQYKNVRGDAMYKIEEAWLEHSFSLVFPTSLYKSSHVLVSANLSSDV
jgi:hypothetical protein